MVYKCLHCRKRFTKDKYNNYSDVATPIEYTLCDYCVEHPNSKRFFDNYYSHRKNFLKNPRKTLLREQKIRDKLLKKFQRK